MKDVRFDTPKEILFSTERMYLRKVVPGDTKLLFELDSDPEVMRWISKGQPTPRPRIENELMPKMLGYERNDPPQGFWMAHLLETSEFIGWFHLRPDKIDADEMELGYRLKQSFWNRGLATEGSRELVYRSFHFWGYEKLSARTLALNQASRRVMEKIGLRFEKEFTWGADVLPGWSQEERRGVKYGLNNPNT